jgi:hypothetical protein
VSSGPRVRRADDAAVLKRLGRPTEPGRLGPADDGHAQKGGGPVHCSNHGHSLVEVAAP